MTATTMKAGLWVIALFSGCGAVVHILNILSMGGFSRVGGPCEVKISRYCILFA